MSEWEGVLIDATEGLIVLPSQELSHRASVTIRASNVASPGRRSKRRVDVMRYISRVDKDVECVDWGWDCIVMCYNVRLWCMVGGVGEDCVMKE